MKESRTRVIGALNTTKPVMFAVPGWSVDSTSVVQEKSTAKSDGSSPATSKKRKNLFSHDGKVSKVTGHDLERLWNARGSPKSSTSQQATGSDKAPKRAPNGTSDQAQSMGGQPHAKKEDKSKDKNIRRRENSTKLLEQSPQTRSDSNLKSKPTTLSKGDSEKSLFPRDKVLKALPPAPAPAPATKLTALQSKMRNKLTSARFRHLNETLYTTSSSAAMDLFTNSPDLFSEYHAGFSQQVKDAWPVNPVDKYIAAIKTRGAIPSPVDKDRRHKADTSGGLDLPRRSKTSICTIADLGCGDAPLARGSQSVVKSCKLKFHNFDLHAPNTQVTKADISNLPLRDGEADIAVFCLSLMGTNWISFVEEAWRILRGDGKGECWVSEVKSRFGRVGRRLKGEAVENSVGKRRKTPKGKPGDDDIGVGEEVFAEDAVENPGDETDVSSFVKVFTRRGFQLREGSVDKANKMFVSMIFTKSGIPTAGKHKGLKWTGREYQTMEEKMKRGGDEEMTPEEEGTVLKPCVYKTR